MKSSVDSKSGIEISRKPEVNRVPVWVMPLVKSCIVLVDGLAALGCFLLAFYLREGTPIFLESSWNWSEQFAPYAAVALALIPFRILALAYQHTYRLQGAFSYLAESIKVFKAVFAGSLFAIALTFLFRGGFEYRDFSYSRGVFLLDFVIAMTVFLLLHLGLRFLQSVFRKRDINLIPTLIVGTNSAAAQTASELRRRKELGYRVVGAVASTENSEPNLVGTDGNVELEVLGRLNELPSIIRELAIQEVIITDDTIPPELLFETMMETGRNRRVEFRLAPSVYNFLPQKTSVEQIGVLPMVRLFREPLSDYERFLKRASDIVIATITLLVLAPVWIIASFLIKLDSSGKILFRQERVGMDGRKFLCLKFRTMFEDADETVHETLYRENIKGDLSSESKENEIFGKIIDDPRVTRIGRYLRRSSLDELPQLLNVLKGDMSVVGPRPPIPYEVKEYSIWHRKRLDMKPGITGLWQVSGRNRLTFEEMVKIDLYYIENWSLWLDIKVIVLTVPAMLRGEGEKG